MKIITRTLIVLAAALVVVAISMGLQSTGLLSFANERGGSEGGPPAEMTSGGEGSRPQGGRPAGFGGGHQAGFGHREGERHGGDGVNLFAAGELIKNLVITAVIIALFSLFSWGFKTLRPQRR